MSLPTEASDPSSGWSLELEERLKQLRASTLLAMLIGLAGLGVLLLRMPDELLGVGQSLGAAFLTFALVGLVYGLHRRHYALSVWLLLCGSTAILYLVIQWTDEGTLAMLFILPVIVATLLNSIAAGLATSLLLTLALVLQTSLLPSLDEPLRFAVLIGIWATEGALILTLSPILKTVGWAWLGYERHRELLEEARDAQQRLQETLQDLTEANTQLQRLNRLAQGLREATEHERRVKEQFVANVSHELRTPLNMIVGFCEMIIEAPETYGPDLPPSLLADLDVIFRNSQHLASLIDDVLDISQIEVGQMALVREHASFTEIVDSAVTAVKPLYQSKSLALDVVLPSNLPSVFCDSLRIREVLLNLLSNAGRFTEEGGVTIGATQEGNDLTVSVRDTGPGISAAQQTRLFTPFEQLDGTIRRRFGGTGLGLSISKSFVELHDGRMWVESHEGEGTTFYFSLPITLPAPMEDGYMRWVDPYNPYEPRHRPLRLPQTEVRPRWVIQERGEALYRLLSRHLEGVDLLRVETLEAAVRAVTETPSQALLINTLTVGQTLEQLEREGRLPRGTPAIVCSIAGVEEAANGLGAAGYLVKPISREKLLSALAELGRPVETVLIVDDEREAQMLFRRMLTNAKESFRVLRAENGRQAIAVLEGQRPDVILLDLTMPEMDGFEFLRLREGASWRDVPVILISARDPLGHPIVSNTLAVTSTSGLSARQILTSLTVLTTMLSPGLTDGDSEVTIRDDPPDPSTPEAG
jgi:signal transduction histidine kinase/CheY-like chemotaxis protein